MNATLQAHVRDISARAQLAVDRKVRDRTADLRRRLQRANEETYRARRRAELWERRYWALRNQSITTAATAETLRGDRAMAAAKGA